MTKTKREEVLELQNEMLKKRIAYVASFLHDCTELMRHDGTVNEGAFHALLTALLNPYDEPIFEDIRDLPEYKSARVSVEVMLQHKLKEANDADRQDDRADQVRKAG